MTKTANSNMSTLAAGHSGLQTHLTPWLEDIARHDTLLTELNCLEKLQSDLTARICVLRNQAPTDQPEGHLKAACISIERQVDHHETQHDARLAEITAIEERILTKVPTSRAEASTLILFLSKVLGRGRELEAEYLSDILSDCVLALQEPEPHVLAA